MPKPVTRTFTTRAGLTVTRTQTPCESQGLRDDLRRRLDDCLGVLLFSDFEYPGRYRRWDIGFSDPPLALNASGRSGELKALNARGRILLASFADAAGDDCRKFCTSFAPEDDRINFAIRTPERSFAEEQRSRQDSIFSLIRRLLDFLRSPQDEPYLGLYGAFGYNLAFQFEPVNRCANREDDSRDLALYLPDRIMVIDHQKQQAHWFNYEFTDPKHGSTAGLPREPVSAPLSFADDAVPSEAICDHQPGDYADTVKHAKEYFRKGDLFETVPGVNVEQKISHSPAQISKNLERINPSPYGFFMNLGRGEYLIGASPEMFVRVDGKRVETCPISGTIKRGGDPIGDARQILTLLNSTKEEAELTMCTDVDRNDKSRICEPGSVKILGRRQIEIYSHLIHTVDHVEGILRDGFDALDAFLTHSWAVTVTGAPKKAAMQFIETHERSPRRWYGGAVGSLFANGNINTGLTLRTLQVKDGIASIRAGATLLYDSDPAQEEAEITIKSRAMRNALHSTDSTRDKESAPAFAVNNDGGRLLLIDHEDSFVHTLGNYFRQTGMTVETLRADMSLIDIFDASIDGIVLSPGPGRPADFAIDKTIAAALQHQIPLFGICLGLQAIAEYFGARLEELSEPVHGKPCVISTEPSALFAGLPQEFTAARYHSLYVDAASVPADLSVSARADDGVIMAIEHRSLPIWAVQFHPESLLTLQDGIGLQLIHRAAQLMRQTHLRA